MAEDRELVKKEEGGKVEPLKGGCLRDDAWEDLAIRHSIAEAGGDEDKSCRVYPEVNKTGEARLISAGKPEVLETLDKALRAKKLEHERLDIEKYPGDEGFPAEKARLIAAPRIARTIKAIREAIGAPKLPLLGEVEDVAVAGEKRLEAGLHRFLGLEPPRKEKEDEESKLEEVEKATEGFRPKFDTAEKEE